MIVSTKAMKLPNFGQLISSPKSHSMSVQKDVKPSITKVYALEPCYEKFLL